jgi:Zn-dependent oligopeptidase
MISINQGRVSEMRHLAALMLVVMTHLAVGYEIPADSPIADALRQAEADVAAVVAIPDSDRTFKNTIGALDDAMMRLQQAVWYPQIMAYLSTDAEARAQGRLVSEHESNWLTELATRRDLYEAIKAYAAKGEDLGPLEQRYLDHILRDYRRSGMDLPEAQRQRYKEILQELTKLGLEFDQNINEDGTRIRLTQEELAGVPASVMARLAAEKSGEIYQVPARLLDLSADHAALHQRDNPSQTLHRPPARRWPAQCRHAQEDPATAI